MHKFRCINYGIKVELDDEMEMDQVIVFGQYGSILSGVVLN